MTPVTPTNNLHSIYCYGGRLCVECTDCGHRNVLTETELGWMKGNMKPIYQFKIRCRCGSLKNERLLPVSQVEAMAWLGQKG